jgi:hypothetical protein
MTDLNTTSLAPSLDYKERVDRMMEKSLSTITKIVSRLRIYMLYSVAAGKPLKSDAVNPDIKTFMQ